MSNTHLHLIQIGPVQSFIAAARRTQDLFVGSRLLSMIASAGVRAAQQADPNAELLFPVLDDQGQLPPSVPHRFAFLSAQDPVAIADKVEQAVRAYWKHEIANKVRDWLHKQIGDGAWAKVFDRQVENWLEVYCVAVPYNENDHGKSYQAAVEAMSARKQARHFPQVNEPGKKCTLTGAQSALSLDWDALKKAINDVNDIELRPNERLGSALLNGLAWN